LTRSWLAAAKPPLLAVCSLRAISRSGSSAFIDTVSPYLKSLPERSPHRSGNVSRAELLGRDVWSELNHYLLLATVDIGDPGIEQELSALLPQGTQISGLGDFSSLREWPEPAGTTADPN
jgi:hypothetical protein